MIVVKDRHGLPRDELGPVDEVNRAVTRQQAQVGDRIGTSERKGRFTCPITIYSFHSLIHIAFILLFYQPNGKNLVRMVTTFPTSIVLECLIILHKANNRVLYVFTPSGINIGNVLVEEVRRLVENKTIALSGNDGDISQYSISGKSAVILTGRFEHFILFINKNPDWITRDALYSFESRFHGRWARELTLFQTNLEMDLGFLSQRTAAGGNVEDLIKEAFTRILGNTDERAQSIEGLVSQQKHSLLRGLLSAINKRRENSFKAIDKDG